MKKIFTFLFAFGMVLNLAHAQLEDGVKLTTNITGTDHLGNPVDLFAELDAGKSAVLDVFAAWCGPCWSYHESGFLKDMWADFGPEGDNSLLVLAIEGEDGNTPAQLTGTSGSGVFATFGDWTEGVTYPIIDDGSFNASLDIGFFPTLYLVRPDRTVILIQGFRYNRGYYEQVLFNDLANDAALEEPINDVTFCNSNNRRYRAPVRNMGTETIESAEINFYMDGDLVATESITDVAPLEAQSVDFGRIKVEETTSFEIRIESVNGELDNNEFFNSTGESSAYKVEIPMDKVTVEFTTDAYPGEISWVLTLNGDELEGDSYTGLASGGAGGADAHTTFTYEVDIDADDAECMQLTISDSFGDGMTAFNDTHPVPGIELKDEFGNVLRPKIRSDYSFAASSTSSMLTSLSVGVDRIDALEELSVAPNPTSDVLNISATFSEASDISLIILDQLGRTVHSQSTLTGTDRLAETLDVSHLQAGMYVLRIANDKGAEHIKFMKQ